MEELLFVLLLLLLLLLVLLVLLVVVLVRNRSGHVNTSQVYQYRFVDQPGCFSDLPIKAMTVPLQCES